MPRYYFHVDSHAVYDDEGVELENIAAARNHSLLLLQVAFEECGEVVTHGKQWVVTIADEGGKRLLRVEVVVSNLSAQATTERRSHQTH